MCDDIEGSCTAWLTRKQRTGNTYIEPPMLQRGNKGDLGRIRWWKSTPVGGAANWAIPGCRQHVSVCRHRWCRVSDAGTTESPYNVTGQRI
jgi:hypothetical protein